MDDEQGPVLFRVHRVDVISTSNMLACENEEEFQKILKALNELIDSSNEQNTAMGFSLTYDPRFRISRAVLQNVLLQSILRDVIAAITTGSPFILNTHANMEAFLNMFKDRKFTIEPWQNS